MLMIIRSGEDESQCTDQVDDEIDDIIYDCVGTSTGNTVAHPNRKKSDRRRALRAKPMVSRELMCTGCSCTWACIMMGYCSDTCGGGSTCTCDRRLEEEFLAEEGDTALMAALDAERELSIQDDNVIQAACKTQLKDYAHDATHNCLGDFQHLDVEVVTSG
jgi:hypothetical protein